MTDVNQAPTPFAVAVFNTEPQSEEGVPLPIRQELMRVAERTGASYYYLCAIYRQGVSDSTCGLDAILAVVPRPDASGGEQQEQDSARSDQPQPGSWDADPRGDDRGGLMMPNVGDTVRYDFLGAIWTDDVTAVEGDLFWTRNHGKALHRSALVIR